LDKRAHEPIMVELGERSYPVHVKPGLLKNAGPLISKRLPQAGRASVVTSDPIHELYGETLLKSLEDAEIKAEVALVPDGEEAKSWTSAGELVGELLGHGLDRGSTVVAFGGGAIGDLAGFVASIYMRGVSLVQVPTTLLAQVDSSLGGKAAVNHPLGKNLIGSFHQPSIVISDPKLLSTLPAREVLSGLGEVVKHGVIADDELFRFIEENIDALKGAEPGVMNHVVRSSVTIKARLVTLDERETKGLRAILNYGHTVGHALETASRHMLRHGEAVALGMKAATRIARELDLIEGEEVERQARLLDTLGFKPVHGYSVESLIDLMHRDKKVIGGSIRMVLPTGIGTPPVVRSVEDSIVAEALVDEGFG